jgi:3-hydroxyisobutyrate dehydrogenase-like beta-hydroxyacid dehydrogenase
MRVGFIGLGLMGDPIARNMVGAGHDLTVWNRTAAKAEPAMREGAKRAGSAREAAACDVLVTMVSDDKALEKLFFEDGLLEALPKGAVHLSLSTISVAFARKLGEAHAAHGQSLVVAPVVGRPERAEQRLLYVIASGPADALERCLPLLEATSQRVFDFGEDPGSAAAVKAANNFMIGATIEMLGEAFSIMDAQDIPRQDFLDFATETLFAAPIVKIYGKLIVEGAPVPGASPLWVGLKDMGLAMDAAAEGGRGLPLAELVHTHLSAMSESGLADHDWSAMGAEDNAWPARES